MIKSLPHSVKSLYLNVSSRNLLREILKNVHIDTTTRLNTVKGYESIYI